MLPKQLSVLGLKARDRVLGLEGVITAINFDLYGCSRATLSIINKDGNPHGWVFDFSRLEVTSTTPVVAQPKFSEPDQLPTQLASLGLMATDKITGKSGCISSIDYDIAGVVFACVTPPNGDEKSFFLDYHRLTISDERKMDAPDYSKEYVEGPDVSTVPRGCFRDEIERI